eukprot:gene18236-23286_t
MQNEETVVPGAETQAETAPAAPARKRPKPGERRAQILQTLAAMLEQPGAERVTTAALAARLEVSEAALYRHFASKAQMFEGLIDFIEQSVFTLVNQILEREATGKEQAARIIAMLVQFVREESREQRPAREPVLARLLELLLIEALRSTGGTNASSGLAR